VIKAMLWWEADDSMQVGEPMKAVMDAIAQREAARHGYEVESREETKSDDGHRVILVWNLK
jgi:hypothetical protein